MSDIRVLLSSIDPPSADAFAEQMCASGWVACVNVVPGVRSHYWWDGKLCCDDECLLVMETSAASVAGAMEHATRLHPYDTPKLVAIDPSEVSGAFAQWCLAAVEGRQKGTAKPL